MKTFYFHCFSHLYQIKSKKKLNSINLFEEVFSQDKSNQSSEIIFLFPRVHQLTQEPDRADQIKGVALTSSGMTCAIGSQINLLISKCIMRSLPSPGDCCSWRTQGVLGRSLGRAQGDLRERVQIYSGRVQGEVLKELMDKLIHGHGNVIKYFFYF